MGEFWDWEVGEGKGGGVSIVQRGAVVSDFTLIRVQVRLEGQELLVGATGAAVEVQAREDLHIAHTSRVRLQHFLYPLGLIVRTLRRRRRRKMGRSRR